MAKKGNASRRAMAELLSNSAVDMQNISETKENDRREALKTEFFKTYVSKPSDVSDTSKTALPSEKRGDFVNLDNTSQTTPPAVQKREALSRMNKAGVKAPEGRGYNKSAAESRERRTAASTPSPSKVPPRTLPAGKRADSAMSRTSEIPMVTDKKAIHGNTSQVEKLHAGKKTAPKKMKGIRIALTSSIAFGLIAAVVASVYFLFPKKEPVIPADILAGSDDIIYGQKISSYTGSAADYVKDNRYDVSFTFYQSPTIVCNTASVSVGQLMKEMGVECGADNRMAESPDDVISSDSSIDIKSLSYETAYATEAVDYETEYVDIRTIPRGSTKVKQDGKRGVKTYTYTCTLVNGVEESRELVKEEITEKPTKRILYRGVGGTITSGGVSYSYSYYIDVMATCYNIEGTTASGLPTSTSVMAVDPRVIPLGTKCVVTGGSGDYGYRIAADTGGAIKGNKIDLWYPAGTFSGFGWRSTRVYILD